MTFLAGGLCSDSMPITSAGRRDARQERRDPDRLRPSTRLSRDSQADQRIKQDKSHVGGRAIIRIAKRKAKFGI
jgi:hypothetical protein